MKLARVFTAKTSPEPSSKAGARRSFLFVLGKLHRPGPASVVFRGARHQAV
jgi:hypothetical protein